MNLTKEQTQAYTEVIEVLKYMSEEDVAKIPEEIYKYYDDNKDKSYNFSVDTTKKFEEQNLLEETKIVFAILYRDYWATEEQREKIKLKEKQDLEQIELEKREKYNPDNIFNNSNSVADEKSLVEVKNESLFTKIINFIKNLFK